ncbi:MAG TPA: chondroitinase-B domain-containing protein [Dermatophilaceae bacterium]|nr:chondroitinase-B domain-containing protein [Dermatophilaceae bacterium]
MLGTACLTAAASTVALAGPAGAQVSNGSLAAPAPLVVSTITQLQDAIKSAAPGTVIKLKSGTYNGVLNIQRSGTAALPITLTNNGDGPVTLTASLRMPSCGASSPDPNRTITFGSGASYWTITGLNIRGGIMIMGGNAGKVRHWLNTKSLDWQARRAVPGRGSYNPTGIDSSTPYLQNKVGVPLRPSYGIKIVNNDLSLKGIHSAMNKRGVIAGNQIHDIACGVGPGVWLGSYSDGWQLTGNTVHDIAQSTFKHYMQEGIRIGGSSAYNTVSGNTIYNLPGDGRAFTTDEDGSWNTFTKNTARNVAIGFNDQMSGWGNFWTYNTVTTFRTSGFGFRMKDAGLKLPSMNSSTNKSTISCNTATGGKISLQAGAMMDSTFNRNAFTEVQLSPNLRNYWTSQGDMWNGSTKPPAQFVNSFTTGC